MDAKDLRTEAALGDRSNDGNTKYAPSAAALACHRNKSYQDIGSNSLGKVDAPNARPCAVIGPDRVVPPPVSTDAYLKKGPLEPWLAPDNTYRRPPEYPHKVLDYQHPTRNISPRQTFQENMQRIMVPPSYNSLKLKEDLNFQEGNISQMRNTKMNVPTDSTSKYCDVPYNVNPLLNEQKNVRNSDISVSNMNNVLTRSAPHGWPPSNVNVRPPKHYPQEVYQYAEYPSCAGPRPILMSRPHRSLHEEPGPMYSDAYYHDGSIRFKPYPPVKERYPQPRYEYIGNYSNQFHPPPPFPTHKYDLQKPMPGHPYPGYSQVPMKYIDGRMAEPIMNGYQRPLNPQANYNNLPFRNQMIHPTYGPIAGNCLPPNKFYPYPPDGSKTISPNKLPYDTNSKAYTEFDNTRNKTYPMPDGFYVNDVTRTHPMKGQVLPPNYPTNVHGMPPHAYYRKENVQIKSYDYNPHFRNIDPNLNINSNTLSRFQTQFSPNAITISPSDSNTSNDTIQTHGTSQEDCGYVSQSSTASARSMDSNISRMHHDVYRRYDQRYGSLIKSSPLISKHESNSHATINSKEKKGIDVRQFLQMWNEGEDDNGENAKEVIIKTNDPNENKNQEQLYVLGLVNVPSEELGKYEHIQKVSKLPENIKGYSSIELLHQFEEVIESSNLNNYQGKPPRESREFRGPVKGTIPMHSIAIPSRPLSPLDVEAKISQSVIHKEVGCNFEIKPCSPKMLNVEVATPVQNVLSERAIEKVSNPLIINSSLLPSLEENSNNVIKCQERSSINESSKVASCKMINTQYSDTDLNNSVKTNYSLQDLESNSGVCLASLPRLDNDIELNFPEVNQQFINANKVESVITTAPLKDLPPLDVVQTGTKTTDGIENEINGALNASVEKDFSKLSKYRKLKRKGREIKKPESSVQALRTDSVIIKNPENNKSQEHITEKTTVAKDKSVNAQNDPINLSVNIENRGNNSKSDFETNSLNEKSNSFAIDFSLNSNENYEYQNNSQDSEKNTNLNPNFQYDEYSTKTKKSTICEDISICNIFKHTDLSKYNDNRQSFENNIQITNEKESFNVPILDVTETIKKTLDVEIPNSESDHDTIQSMHNKEKSEELFRAEKDNLKPISPNKDNTQTTEVDNVFLEASDADLPSNLNLSPKIQYTGYDIENNCDTNMNKSCKPFDKTLTHENGNLMLKIEKKSKNDETSKDYSLQPDEEIMLEHRVVQVIPEQKIIDNKDDKHSLEPDASHENVCKETSDNVEMLNQNISTLYIKIQMYKELLSPWIQKLIMHSEGPCLLPVHSCTNVDKSEVREISNMETSNANDNSRMKSVQKYTSCYVPDETVLDQIGDSIMDDTMAHNLYKSSGTDSVERCAPRVLSLNEETVTECETDTLPISVNETEVSKKRNINVKRTHSNIDTYIDSLSTKTLLDSLSPHSSELDTDILHNSSGIAKIENKDCQYVNARDITKDGEGLDVNTFTDKLHEEQLKQKTEIAYMKSKSRTAYTEDPDLLRSKNEPVTCQSDITTLEQKSELARIKPNSDIANTDDSGILPPLNESFQSDLSNDTEKAPNKETAEVTQHIPEEPDGFQCCMVTVDGKVDTAMVDKKIYVEHLKSTSSPTRNQNNNSNVDNPASNNFISRELLSPQTPKYDCEIQYNDIEASAADFELEGDVEKEDENVAADNTYCDDSEVMGSEDLNELADKSKDPECIDFQNWDKIVSEDLHLNNPIQKFTHNESQIDVMACTDNKCDLDKIPNSVLEASNKQNLHEQQFKESTTSDEIQPHNSNKVVRYTFGYSKKKRKSLKRSLSDSALDEIRDQAKDDRESASELLPSKRKKYIEPKKYEDCLLNAENECNITQTNRRNSISIIQNDDNVSFCILIDDNCIITEESEETPKLCFTEVPEDCLTCMSDVSLNEETESRSENISHQEEFTYEGSSLLCENFVVEDKSVEGPWVDDIACVETVVSDDIAENIVISAFTSPKDTDLSDADYEDESELYNINEHTDKLKYIYGDKMCNDDAQFVETLYRTPQMNVNRTLINRESHSAEDCSRYYDKESLERVLSESNTHEESARNTDDVEAYLYTAGSVNTKQSPNKENLNLLGINIYSIDKENKIHEDNGESFSNINMYESENGQNNFEQESKVDNVSSCESSIDDVFTYSSTESPKCATSSSPEVSSTTSEEKNSGILLKITNFRGSRISQVSDVNPGNNISCKYTEKKDYLSSNSYLPTRTLITKAAQKYIPPLKESIPDLKVKLALPQHSLIKLKQLKLAKESPKPNVSKSNNVFRKEVPNPKKPKPKFEDVLKSIDEIQFQKHKEKTKKIKKSIPKVVIKKSENGSHYASTSNKDKFNPDLTGCKWQPWVFIEKSPFIDKMALKHKTRAVFSHRKNIYVLAEKFQKYKSVSSSKFVISQPKLNDSSSGQLKYTIRLKHSY